ncbi:2OG-Fe(II) oxygenase [Streptomyces mangrovi]|uniref:2OG-Fe(II) oxygenase n=1 Tax=Streptomyces mangrovi TaxID=1206892 RepID=UPI00399CDF2F
MKIDGSGDGWLNTAGRFISQEYLEPKIRQELHDWFQEGSGGPRTLPGFLEEGFARTLGRCLRGLPHWQRYASVYEGDVRTNEVTEEEWEAHPTKAARHFLLRPLLEAVDSPEVAENERKALGQFLGFAVTGPTLLSWVSSVVGHPLEPRTSFEFTRYGPGDQITPHHDLLPGRVLAVNFYLDEHYDGSTGGRLWYRDADGRDHVTAPEFNSFTMIPIRTGCTHWVEPWNGNEPGRYTANLQIHREY